MRKIGFDNDKYLRTQTENIRSRIQQFGGKLYLEFGGKLFDDYHASRVLPGFKPDSKVQMLMQMRDDAEVLIVISANDIERNKRRGDLGITYDEDTLRLIDAFRGIGLYVGRRQESLESYALGNRNLPWWAMYAAIGGGALFLIALVVFFIIRGKIRKKKKAKEAAAYKAGNLYYFCYRL